MLSHSTEQLDGCFAALVRRSGRATERRARAVGTGTTSAKAPRAGRALLACGVRGIVTPQGSLSRVSFFEPSFI